MIGKNIFVICEVLEVLQQDTVPLSTVYAGGGGNWAIIIAPPQKKKKIIKKIELVAWQKEKEINRKKKDEEIKAGREEGVGMIKKKHDAAICVSNAST